MKSSNKLISGFALLCFCLTSVLLSTSCKKKSPAIEVVEQTPASPTVTVASTRTIYPGLYLPAYPGSYWVYAINGNTGSTSTISAARELVHDSANVGAPNYLRAMVPVYNNLKLWGNSTYEYTHSGNTMLVWRKLLVDTAPVVGQRWESAKDYLSSSYIHYRVTLATDTSVSINSKLYDHVIVTRDYVDFYGSIQLGTDRYYAKNVGMVAEYSYNNKFYRSMKPTDYVPKDSVVYRLELLNYHINK